MSGRSVHRDRCQDRISHRRERDELEDFLRFGIASARMNYECCGNGCCGGYWAVMSCGCLFIAEQRAA
jgi:hypothetical protein